MHIIIERSIWKTDKFAVYSLIIDIEKLVLLLQCMVIISLLQLHACTLNTQSWIVFLL